MSSESFVSLLELNVSPRVEVPLQSSVRPLFSLGYGTDLAAYVPIERTTLASPALALSYTLLPIRAESSLSIIRLGLGPRVVYEASTRLCLFAELSGGGYVSQFNETPRRPDGAAYEVTSGASGYAGADVGVSFFLVPFLSAGARVGYDNHFGLYHSASASLSVSIHVDGFERKIRIEPIEVQPIYPVLLQYYGEASMGRALVRNDERFPIREATLEIAVPGYVARPMAVAVAEELAPGEHAQVELSTLFSDRVLENLEARQTSAALVARYALSGRRYETVRDVRLRLYNRNALTWDDDRKAAAFVTPRDTDIRTFATSAVSVARGEGPVALNLNLRVAMAVYEALAVHGLAYVIDPDTPAYTDASTDTAVVDYLQFAGETLAFHGGDCDDLSILYASALESVGIPTAFITIPGHIFTAFSTGVSVEEAVRTFGDESLVIDHDGTAWIPIEMTAIGRSFREAWRIGADQWRTRSREGLDIEEDEQDAGFYPTRESWEVYPPAGTPGDVSREVAIDPEALRLAYRETIADVLDARLAPQVARLQELLRTTRAPERIRNRLGALYARYGLLDEAVRILEPLAEETGHPPALVNLGNIRFLQGRFEEAHALYEEAARFDPGNPVVLVGLARVAYELDDMGALRTHFANLERVDPALSEEFSYLAIDGRNDDDRARASEVDLPQTRVLWEDPVE
ncbi:MAG: tetratricopeptide repeat protein [Spirochaetota bacterium]